MQFKIKLKNCAFFARHGVYREEEKLGQRFFVDAELTVEDGGGLANDDIEGTVDYGVAFSVIEKIVTGTRRYLIEALALDIAKAMFKSFDGVQNVSITIRKPNAPVNGILDHVEVTVACVREL
jgi:dihydroneopterin aldolase